MLKISFKYDLKKDAYNWARQAIFLSPGSSDHISSKIREEINRLYKENPISHVELIESLNHPVIDFIVDYLKKTQDANLVESNLKKLGKKWRENETSFLEILSKIIQKTIYKAEYVCYLSTIRNCPFYEKENWFMVSAFSELSNQIYVVAHEFMHLQFIYWYKKYCIDKGLTNKGFWNIQEAITFLLNEPEFRDIISFQDKGLNIHQELRQKLKKIWEENKDFKVLLDEAINIVLALEDNK